MRQPPTKTDKFKLIQVTLRPSTMDRNPYRKESCKSLHHHPQKQPQNKRKTTTKQTKNNPPKKFDNIQQIQQSA